ncbi:MAG: hypothetical protein ACK559_06475, partial [bacterium]
MGALPRGAGAGGPGAALGGPGGWSMREEPLVSLIMLTWQHEAWIEAALTAALSQEGAPIEVLLSDDASDDA